EVFNYIQNINNLTIYNDGGKTYFASLVEPKIEFNPAHLWDVITFEESTANSKHEKLGVKVSKSGGFNGEFDRFISRLETKLSDKRLNFI
ncbi:ATPase, partial [Acinetobacter baumannii]